MCVTTSTSLPDSTTFVDRGPLVTVSRAVTIAGLIDAEVHARECGRLIELDLSSDAQREARIVFLVAARLRSRRLAA
jgi:hypothetical protein